MSGGATQIVKRPAGLAPFYPLPPALGKSVGGAVLRAVGQKMTGAQTRFFGSQAPFAHASHRSANSSWRTRGRQARCRVPVRRGLASSADELSSWRCARSRPGCLPLAGRHAMFARFDKNGGQARGSRVQNLEKTG